MTRAEMLGDQIRNSALEGLLRIKSQVIAVGERNRSSQESTLSLVDEEIRIHLKEAKEIAMERRRVLESVKIGNLRQFFKGLQHGLS